MSWSVYRYGTKEAVLRDAAAAFDKAADGCAWQPSEKAAILIAKTIVLAAIDGIPSESGVGVKVECSGSASKESYFNMKLDVARIVLSVV